MIAELAKQFRVSHEFVCAVLDKIVPDWRSARAKSAEAFFEEMPGSKVYVHYALSSLFRGRLAVDRVMRRGSFSGKRALDIGCGTGGVVRAFGEAGCETVGIELELPLAQLARAAVRDLPNVSIISDDIFAVDYTGLGTFDAICCNAVIEHVANPAKLLEVIAKLLNPGGFLHLEVPNKDCIRSVGADLHYQSFGLQLLPYGSAFTYHGKLRLSGDYTVGEFFERQWYESRLSRLGLSINVEVADWGSRFETAEADLGKVWTSFLDWSSATVADSEYLIRAEIKQRFLDYFAKAVAALASANAGDIESFEMRYCAEAWTLVCQMNGK